MEERVGRDFWREEKSSKVPILFQTADVQFGPGMGRIAFNALTFCPVARII